MPVLECCRISRSFGWRFPDGSDDRPAALPQMICLPEPLIRAYSEAMIR